MSLRTPAKPFIFKYALFTAFVCSSGIHYPGLCDDVTIGDLNARIDDLERQISEGGEKTDDENPGKQVTAEDLERLKEEMRALKGGSDDMNRLRDELSILHEDIKQLKKENADLRTQKAPKKAAVVSGDSEDEKPTIKSKSESRKQTQSLAPQTSSLEEDVDSEEERPTMKTKGESRKQSQTLAPQASSLDVDDETMTVLSLLEKSAPGGDQEDAQGPQTKNQKKNADIETVREAATKNAESTAPKLTVGNAEAQYNEAFALHDKGAYKEAVKAFDYFITTYPDDRLVPKAMFWKGESCLKLKNYKDAKILFVNSYKKNPKGPKAPDCLLKLGEVLALEGKRKDACTAWRKLKDDFPHMTSEMQSDLSTLKTTYGCEKNSEITPKPAPKG